MFPFYCVTLGLMYYILITKRIKFKYYGKDNHL